MALISLSVKVGDRVARVNVRPVVAATALASHLGYEVDVEPGAGSVTIRARGAGSIIVSGQTVDQACENLLHMMLNESEASFGNR
jgi:anti-sigma-K factor RskA